jgi:hypothetical protein
MSRRWFLLLWVCIAAFVISSRYEYRFPYLYSWDGVQFALSIKDFNVIKHQPHPPGYIFYSGALKVLNRFISDANEDMLLLDISASVFACFLIYLIVHELIPGTDRKRKVLLAGGASAIYATNPVAWFNGCISETYAVEGFLVSALIYLLVLSRKRPSLLPLTSIIFGLVGGVRLTTEIFLLPAYLLVLWKTRNNRTIISSLLCLITSNLLWFVPVVYLSKGVKSYLTAFFRLGTRVTLDTGGVDSGRLLEIPLLLLQCITLPIFLILLFRFRKIRFESIEWLLVAAILPALSFFLFGHFPKNGYLLAIIPTIIILSILFLQKADVRFPVTLAVLLSAILLNYFIFTKPPTITKAEIRAENGKKVLYEFTSPNKDLLNLQAERFRMFFRKVSELGNGKKLFVVQTGNRLLNFRTLMFNYPGDIVVTVASKVRTTFATDYQSAAVPNPVPINEDVRIVVLIGPKPKDPRFQSFKVYEYTYYYARLPDARRDFKIYSIPFSFETMQRD